MPTPYHPDDVHMCDICNKEFVDDDTYWKCDCKKCRKGCCRLHRVEESGDYDDHCVCTDCDGWCHLCLTEEDRLEEYKTYCNKCMKVVCHKHYFSIGYCAVICRACAPSIVEAEAAAEAYRTRFTTTS